MKFTVALSVVCMCCFFWACPALAGKGCRKPLPWPVFREKFDGKYFVLRHWWHTGTTRTPGSQWEPYEEHVVRTSQGFETKTMKMVPPGTYRLIPQVYIGEGVVRFELLDVGRGQVIKRFEDGNEPGRMMSASQLAFVTLHDFTDVKIRIRGRRSTFISLRFETPSDIFRIYLDHLTEPSPNQPEIAAIERAIEMVQNNHWSFRYIYVTEKELSDTELASCDGVTVMAGVEYHFEFGRYLRAIASIVRFR